MPQHRAFRLLRSPERIALTVFVLLLLSATLVAGVVFGRMWAEQKGPLHWLSEHYRQWQGKEAPAIAKAVTEGKRVESVLLDLSVSAARLGGQNSAPVYKRGGVGGVLAQVGDDMLLLTNGAEFYRVTDPENMEALSIQGPDRRREAYHTLAEEAGYEHLLLLFEGLRYNDMLAVPSGESWRLFVSYTEYHPHTYCVTNTLSSLTLDANGNAIEADQQWSVLARTEPCLPLKNQFYAVEGHMAGGRLALVTPDALLWTSGDYHFDGTRSAQWMDLAQRDDADYGKLLQVDLRSGALSHVAKGLRNPQGIAVDAEGHVLIHEHGPKGGDELNLIEHGANYGWPLESFGVRYSGTALPLASELGRVSRFSKPLMAWVPSIAPGGMVFLHGFHPDWDGDLLVSTLKDTSLRRLRYDSERVYYDERIPLDPHRIRDMALHTNGKLYLWTDQYYVLTVEPAPQSRAEALVQRFVLEAALDSAEAASLHATLNLCVECHSLTGEGKYRAAPLDNVLGRPIASVAEYRYTDALLARNRESWSAVSLSAFLASPQAFAPGTEMPALGLEDDTKREVLVRFLEFSARQE